jgi:predicted dehydrogenase
MVRYHPQWLRARALVQAGRIGEVRVVQVAVTYFNIDPANVRNRVDIGGGALYDIGCYAVAAARFMFAVEPRRAVSLIDRDPEMQIDRLTSGLVEFPAGRQLVFVCSTQVVRYQRLQIFGSTGRIAIEIPVNAPAGETTRIRMEQGNSGVAETIAFEPCDHYTLQGDEAARVFLGEIPAPWPIEDGIRNMRVLDALYRSAETAAWEAV